MKTLLLVFPKCNKKTFFEKLFASSSQPLGIYYIESYLKKQNIPCEVIDLNYAPLSLLRKKIPRYTHVALSSIHNAAEQLRETIAFIRKTDSQKTIILGGPSVTQNPSFYCEQFPVDVFVLGEAELTMYELLTKPLEQVSGLIYKSSGGYVATPPRNRIPDLDLLPFPDTCQEQYPYTLGVLDSYCIQTKALITSRGCPFHCQFCDKSVFRDTVTCRSVENIIAEIEAIIACSGIRVFYFVDDIFFIQKDRMRAFCETVIRKNLRISWSCLSRVDLVTADLLTLMKKAGCYRITLGLESGSDETLQKINKQFSVQQIRQGIALIKKVGMEIKANFIVGFPDETTKQRQKTLELIFVLDIDFLLLSQYTDYAQHHEYQRYTFSSALGKQILRTNLRFYLRPRQLFYILRYLCSYVLFVIFWSLKKKGIPDDRTACH